MKERKYLRMGFYVVLHIDFGFELVDKGKGWLFPVFQVLELSDPSTTVIVRRGRKVL